MLLNLLSNAVKFTPAGGSVRLEAVGTSGPGDLRFPHPCGASSEAKLRAIA